MSLGSDLALIHRTMQAHSPRHCRFRGATIPCSASTESRGILIAVGGKELEIQLTLFILKSDLIAGFQSQAPRSPGIPDMIGGDNAIVTGDSDQLTGDDATTPPRAGEIIIYQERRYRIQPVRTDSSDAVYRLELSDINR